MRILLPPPHSRPRRRGVTLVEAVIYAAVFAFVAVATMGALGRAAVLRGMARSRSEMLVVAQGELDRLRMLPVGELQSGTFEIRNAAVPDGTHVECSVSDAPQALRIVRVTVSRDIAEGVESVVLETVLPGAPQ